MGAMRNKKAPRLALSTKQSIGKYADKYPKATANEIADKYNCTVNQARTAISQWKQGELHRSRPRHKAIDMTEISDTPTDKLLELQYKHAVSQLEVDRDMPASDRIALLDKMFGMRKILQQVKLESHIKKADARIFAACVRRYEPLATDEDVIRIYHELDEAMKL